MCVKCFSAVNFFGVRAVLQMNCVEVASSLLYRVPTRFSFSAAKDLLSSTRRCWPSCSPPHRVVDSTRSVRSSPSRWSSSSRTISQLRLTYKTMNSTLQTSRPSTRTTSTPRSTVPSQQLSLSTLHRADRVVPTGIVDTITGDSTAIQDQDTFDTFRSLLK